MNLEAKQTRDELLAQIEDLQERLREAEETLHAIRRGEVDAVIVAGDEGDQIFTLQGADRLYRKLIEQMNEGAVILSNEGLILFSNARFAEMLRTPLDKIIGMPLVHFITSADHAAFESSLSRQTPAKVEVQLRTKADADVPAQLSINWIKPNGARVAGVMITDLTVQKRAEQSLRESSAYNRSLFEASLDPLVTIGAGGKIMDVNAAAEEATGRGRRELIGTDFAEYFTDPARARAGYEQAFREGAVRDYPLEIRRIDGYVTPVLYNASVYRGEAGNVLGVFAAARDITEQQKAEKSLAASESRLRSIVEAEPECVKIVGRDGQLLDMNPAGLAMIECRSLAEAQQQTLAEFVAPEHRAAFCELFQRTLRGESGRLEFETVGLHGKRRWLDCSSVPLRDEAGGIASTLSVTRDITERKAADEELRRQAGLLNLTHDAIIVRDLQDRIVFWNAGAEERYGWTAAEAMGHAQGRVAMLFAYIHRVEQTGGRTERIDGWIEPLRRQAA